MNDHPYVKQPDKAFWSRSVSRNFSTEGLLRANEAEPLFHLNDKVVSAGSCFASNLIPWIEKEGLEYVRTEELPTQFQQMPENLGYRNFSAAYGNIYTARHLRQLYEQALGLRKPIEDRWHIDDLVIDPFRPGLAYPAESDAEFDLLKSAHLSAVRKAFHSATVFVFTLGLTEAWVSKLDDSVFPACPGTISGQFDQSKHEFKNFTVAEVTEDITSFISLLRKHNEHVRFIVTVSPVPLVATATDSHVLMASTYSKSVLRVAAQQVADSVEGVTYFPAFEIVTGPQAPFEYFESDRRNVSEIAVAEVMKSLLFGLTSNESGSETSSSARVKLKNSLGRRISEMSKRIARVECDEAMMDPDIK